MNEITTVGLDLAKRVVSLCGEDVSGRVVIQRTLRREAVLAWFVQRAPYACISGEVHTEGLAVAVGQCASS